MNKTQLVDALAARIGDRRAAATAVDGLLETIVSTVSAGDSVSITGFGVFEPRARAARVARNPRTGETVNVAATTVPAFRPGAGFRADVGGSVAPVVRAAPVRRPRAASVPATVETPAPAAPTRKPAKVKAGTTFAAPTAGKAPAGKTTKAAAPKAAAPKAAVPKGRAAKAKPVDEKPKKAKAKK